MNPRTLVARLTRSRSLVVLLAMLIALTSIGSALAQVTVSGNIAPAAIEIDTTGAQRANLYPGSPTTNPCNTVPTSGSILDWVKDCADHTQAEKDAASVEDSIATGVILGVSGAAQKGHWNGVRIVDGIANQDQDIFLRGGKENDTSSWEIGPGSVGSSKYDMSQSYLANNQQKLFFGMERSGNNGTTAFDFEFNRLAPDPNNPLVPNRSVDDVLFTFEMQGSGNAGSAVPHYYKWNGSAYVESLGPDGKPAPPSSMISSINLAAIPAAPWGYVTDKGVWALGNMDKFLFAEASVDLQQAFPGFDPCGSAAYVQVRTRASAVDTSDLKDTTKIFEYVFGRPIADATLSTACPDQSNPSSMPQFTYDGAGSEDSVGGGNIDYSWDITVSPPSVTLSGGGVGAVDASLGKYTSSSPSGTVNVNFSAAPSSVASATITVKNTVSEGGSCEDSTDNKIVTVYRKLGATATLTPQCDNTFAFSSTVSGGKAPYTYAWTFQRNSNADGTGTWGPASGTFTQGSASSDSGVFQANEQGRYRALLTVTDSADTSTDSDVTPKPECTTNAISNGINVYDAVDGTIKLTPSCGNTFGYEAEGSGGKAPYTYDFTVQKLVSGTWTDVRTFQKTDTLVDPGVSGTLDVTSTSAANFPAGAPGLGSYRMKVTITDSQGLECEKDLTSGPIDVEGPLNPQAAKEIPTSTNVADLTVTVSGSASNADRYQWQISTDGGTTWSDIANATNTSLTYDFAGLTGTAVDFTLTAANGGAAAGVYKGTVYVAQLRLHVERDRVDSTGATLTVCEDDSAAVTVKMVKAVDP